MANSKIDKAFSEAAEIAAKLPKSLQVAAFNKAVDYLLGAPGEGRKKGQASAGTDTPRRAKRRSRNSASNADTSELLNSIDRTKFPKVNKGMRVADRSMIVLKTIHDDFQIDGLPASDISEILTTKLRVATTGHAVIVALGRETETVNFTTGTDGVRLFRIMESGERHVDDLLAARAAGRADGGKPKRSKARSRKKNSTKKTSEPKRETKKVTKKTGSKRTAKKAAKKASKGRVGPKAAIVQLVESGYFDSERAISDVQGELQHRRGYLYTVQELSPALLRCVRDQTLERNQGESGQYGYVRS